MGPELKKRGDFEYIDEGKGEPIVVLHGLFGALSNFKDVIAHFSGNHRVIIPILPIYTLPIIKTSVKSLADFLHDFITEMGFEQVNLLGNSLGGHVALIYTSNHLKNVKTLTLTGSSGLYENAFGGSFPRREDKEYLKSKIALTFYDPAMVTDQLVDECHEAVNNRNKVIRILAMAKSAIRHNMREEIGKMDMPVCLIWGKNDTITPPEVAEEFREKMPNASLFWIDKCGHAPMMEHPQEFNKLYASWLGEIEGTA